jgi:hypothetical protein
VSTCTCTMYIFMYVTMCALGKWEIHRPYFVILEIMWETGREKSGTVKERKTM